jgi:hypothetical protein
VLADELLGDGVDRQEDGVAAASEGLAVLVELVGEADPGGGPGSIGLGAAGGRRALLGVGAGVEPEEGAVIAVEDRSERGG